MAFETTSSAGIRPGTVFIDDRGDVAQLHGVGIQRFGDRFSAWGEDKTAGSTFTAVACYSSTDLARWRFEGRSLVAGAGDLGPDRVIERPKVLRRPGGKYVMLIHVETPGYAFARVGYAIADDPVGPFRHVGSERPLGNASRDIGVYQEDGVEALVATTLKNDGSHGHESPALVRHDGTYYLFGSDLTGWSTNDNRVSTATDLRGPWSAWQDIAPAGSATFDSQVSTVVPIGEEARPSFVYVGDRWMPDDLGNPPAVWLPLEISGGRARIDWTDEWRVEVPDE